MWNYSFVAGEVVRAWASSHLSGDARGEAETSPDVRPPRASQPFTGGGAREGLGRERHDPERGERGAGWRVSEL